MRRISSWEHDGTIRAYVRSSGWSIRTLAAPERAPLARCQDAGNGGGLLAAASFVSLSSLFAAVEVLRGIGLVAGAACVVWSLLRSAATAAEDMTTAKRSGAVRVAGTKKLAGPFEGYSMYVCERYKPADERVDKVEAGDRAASRQLQLASDRPLPLPAPRLLA